jgi:hypothetical protein
MASATPAIDLVSAPAEDPLKSANFIDESSPQSTETRDSDSDVPVAPDRFNPKLETDEWEIWAYYSCYIGDNGLGGFDFAPTAFQNLLYQAGGETVVLRFAGR